MLQTALQRLVAEKIDPLLKKLPEEPLAREHVRQIFTWLEPFGYFGARVPEHLGGVGLDFVTYGVLMEALPPVIAHTAIGQEAAASRVALSGSEYLLERFLKPLLALEKFGASATSEPGAGSDPRTLKTVARRDGDDYVINGQKLWVSNGGLADVLLATVSIERPEGAITGRFMVDKEESPFVTKEVETIGFRLGHLSEVFFEDCRVPARNMLGEPGDAYRYLTLTWQAQRAFYALWGAHLAKRALDASVEYAKQRVQFGQPIGTFQLVQEMIVEIATAVDVSRLLSYRALSLLDRGQRANKECSMAKLYATEAAVRATSLAMQVHGANGLTTEYGLERMYRDARMLTVPEGTTQINQLIVGREILGLRAFSSRG